MLVSIIFSVPSALAFLFYVLWQTYVYVASDKAAHHMRNTMPNVEHSPSRYAHRLRAEFYIGIVAILLLALEVVLGVLTMLAFARQAAFR